MNFFKNMRYGRASGIATLLVSAILLAVNVFSIFSRAIYYPKFLMVGIVLLFTGAAFIIFPGGDFTRNDYPDENIRFSFVWKQAPMLHRVIWIAALFSGLFAGFQTLHFFGQ